MNMLSRLFGQAPSANPSPPAAIEAAAPAPAAAAAAAQADLGNLPEQQLVELAAFDAPTVSAANRAARQQLADRLPAIHSTDVLCALALHAPTSEARQAAAERVTDADTVNRLLKDARGGDKHVYRVLKQKRDAHHAALRRAAEVQAALQTLCATLEHQVREPFGHGYEAALQHLEQQWLAARDGAPADLSARAAAALARGHQVVEEHRLQIAQQQQMAAARDRAVVEREHLLLRLASLLTAMFDGASIEPAALPALRERWQGSLLHGNPDSAQQQRFERCCEAVAAMASFNAQHTSLAAATQTLNESTCAAINGILGLAHLLPEDGGASISAAREAVLAWHQARQAEVEAGAKLQRQLASLLRRAQAALAAGRSREAAGIRRSMDSKLTVDALPAHLQAQLQAFDERLGALQDWRSFAVAPKRGQLIEQMSALIGSTMAPQQLAQAIKQLQDEWKLISKGSTEDTQAEWQQFHEAAQQAYEPCRVHFAEQAQRRSDNLAARQALLERLQAFAAAFDPERPDWSTVGRALRESRQQWLTLQPVERAASKPLQTAFDATSAQLQSLLDAEHQRNVEAKQRLIARAQQQAGATDARAAAETVKQLQQAWKELGPVPQRDSQALWEEFRRHCDAVFANRERAHHEFTSQLATHAARAVELCEQAEALADSSGQALIEASRQMGGIQQAFAELGDLPRAEAGKLRTRLERAVTRCERALAEQRARKQSARQLRILDAADALRRLRLARAQGALDDTLAPLQQELRAFIDSEPRFPKATHRRLLAEADRDCEADVAANEDALRLLVVRAELLAGLPTPDHDQPLRRDWQLKLLTRGLGREQPTAAEAWELLLAECLALGPTRQAAWDEMRARLASCLARAPAINLK